MSSFDNVIGGRLRLKGKALHVKADGITKSKKKRHSKHRYASYPQGCSKSLFKHSVVCKVQACHGRNQKLTGENVGVSKDQTEEFVHETEKVVNEADAFEDHLTAAERKFIQQTRKIELQRLQKISTKSHRDRVQEFNQYLANLTEHYDIPKVGPG